MDFLWSAVVVAPLVVLYWRGTWDLLEDLVFPESEDPVAEDVPLLMGMDTNTTNTTTTTTTLPLTTTTPPSLLHPEVQRQLSGLVCYLAGLIVRISLDLSRFHLGEFLVSRSKYARLVGGWVYTALYALAGVSFWRGVWFLMKLDVGVGTWHLIVVLVGSLAVLLVSRVPKSLISSPLALAMDKHEVTFQNGTFFRKTPEDGWWFLVDVIFTNLVVRQLIVFCWWSLWSLENEFLKLNFMGEESSDVSYDSLLIGYAGAILSVTLDQLVQGLTSTKLYLERPISIFITLLAFFSSVNVWRGVWSMLNHFFLSNLDPDENYVISHIAGLCILSALLLSNTISNDMVVQDSESSSVVNIQYWAPGPETRWNGNTSYSYTPVKGKVHEVH